MPLCRSLAIILRTYRVGEADKVVVFFTLDRGKYRGMARGARRARSRFGASLEIGTEAEVTFFEKEGRELVSVDRCDIVRSSFAKSGEPILATTLGYVMELVDAFVPDREPNERAYRLLRATLGSLCGVETAETRARYFEAWLLRLSGIYPIRRTCPSCGVPLVERGARFSLDERSLACKNCLSGLDRGLPLSPESLRFLEQAWKTAPEALEPPRSSWVLSELRAFHYRLVQEHLEKEVKSHQVLEEMLRAAENREPRTEN